MIADPTLQNSDSRHVAIRRGISIAFVNHSVDRSYGVLDFWGVVLLYTFMISIEVI
jgi:hypothetical protein